MAILFIFFILLASSVSAYTIYYEGEALPSDYTNEVVYYHMGDGDDIEGVSGSPGVDGIVLDYADSDLEENNLLSPTNPRISFVPGKFGNAVSHSSAAIFTGSPLSAADVDFTTGDTIIETWALFPAGFVANTVGFMNWNAGANDNGGIGISWQGGSNVVYMKIGSGSGWVCNPGHNQGTGWVLTDDEWHHYTVHVDVEGNNIDLYRDAVLIDSVTGSECGGDLEPLQDIVNNMVPSGDIGFGEGGAGTFYLDQYIVHQGITDGITFEATVPEQVEEESLTSAQLSANQINNMLSGVGAGIGILLESTSSSLGFFLISLAFIGGVIFLFAGISKVVGAKGK